MFCDQCGQHVDVDAAVCPHCGAQLAGAAPALPPAADRPPAAPTAAVWARALLGRNVAGTAVGIVCAWFGVPMIVLMSGVGAVVGGISGVASGTVLGTAVVDRVDVFLRWVLPLPVKAGELLPTAGAQVGGIVGGLLGAIHGAAKLGWMTAVYPWRALYAGDPSWPAAVALGQIVTALVVGALYVAWRTVSEAWRLRVTGARRLSRREAAWLLPLVDDAAAGLGLARLPRLLVDDDRAPQATAHIRHVVVTAGLLEQLHHDRPRVTAVLAHELAHWRGGDAVSMAWARGVALPLIVFYELVQRMMRVSRARPLQVVLRILFWAVLVTVDRIVLPAQAHVWRAAEYRADAAAAAAGYGPQLREVLGYFRATFDGARPGWDAAVLASHPPYELRMERLETPGRVHPLAEDHPLARSLPGWTAQSTVHRGWTP